jgi:hypothetical protein
MTPAEAHLQVLHDRVLTAQKALAGNPCDANRRALQDAWTDYMQAKDQTFRANVRLTRRQTVLFAILSLVLFVGIFLINEFWHAFCPVNLTEEAFWRAVVHAEGELGYPSSAHCPLGAFPPFCLPTSARQWSVHACIDVEDINGVKFRRWFQAVMEQLPNTRGADSGDWRCVSFEWLETEIPYR